MREELELQLVKKYPTMFKDYRGDMRQTCMAWGFECGNGWYDLIDKMCADVTKLLGNSGQEVIAEQVKEKFGGLRFYYYISNTEPGWFSKLNYRLRDFMCRKGFYKAYWWLNDLRKKIWSTREEKISDRISKAEEDSYNICENCGQPGKASRGGWIKVLCDDCRNTNKK
jgi:hypothetical protein